MPKVISISTICANCAHHIHDIQNKAAPNVWYNHRCAKLRRKETIDHTTGERGYINFNDSGKQYFTKDKYGYCRNLNDGHCPHFKQK